jgi:metallo-beta-lactamase family protein
MSKPSITCYGGVGTVTGANFLLEVGERKFLVDCGLFQGFQGADGQNDSGFDYDPSTIETLFITHAHIDHIGRITDLVKFGFKGEIVSTEETREIAEFMMRDLVHINGGGDDFSLQAMRMWKNISYHEERDYGDFKLEAFDAGHILGSAMYKLTFKSGRSILFSGDIGNSPSPLLKDVESVSGLSYLLMDSVYGDRNHEPKEVRDQKFVEVLKDVIARKSTLLIPVFSLERTQIMVHELDKLFTSHSLPSIPVFLDSPLAINITEIYRKHLKHVGDFDFNKLRETAEVRDSKEIAHVPGPKIIMAGSGMSNGGRIVHHEKRFLIDPNATILFVGYQAAGTMGRLIQEGMKRIRIDESDIDVRAKVVTVEGFSAHAGSDQLVDFVSHSKDTLKKVFITMGEIKSSMFLAQRLKDELDLEAVVPKRGEKYELDL